MGIVRIIAKDIDGPENGSFETDSIDVKIEGFEGSKSWFHGKAEVNIPDIKLKEKKRIKYGQTPKHQKTYRPRAFSKYPRRTGLNYMNCVHSFGSVRFVVMYPAVIAGAIAMSRPLSRICLSKTS